MIQVRARFKAEPKNGFETGVFYDIHLRSEGAEVRIREASRRIDKISYPNFEAFLNEWDINKRYDR